MKKILPYTIITIWIISGLYFGIGGYADDYLKDSRLKYQQYEKSKRAILYKKFALNDQIDKYKKEQNLSTNDAYIDSLNLLLSSNDTCLIKELISFKLDSGKDTLIDCHFINADQYRIYHEIRSTESLFGILENLPSIVILIITACSFGLLGGTIKVIKSISFENYPIEGSKYFSIPILGMLAGLVVFGLSYVIPIVLVSGENEIRKTTLMFISLFAGIMVDKFYSWIETLFNKIFKTQ